VGSWALSLADRLCGALRQLMIGYGAAAVTYLLGLLLGTGIGRRIPLCSRPTRWTEHRPPAIAGCYNACIDPLEAKRRGLDVRLRGLAAQQQTALACRMFDAINTFHVGGEALGTS
jgi:hypothetical protein